MSDEIKEILDFKEDADYKRLSVDEMTILRDYITNLQEENDKFDETMKDIKDNLIARINRQECEIHNLKANLEMYENGVYFSSENDKLQEIIDRLNHSLEQEKKDKQIMIKHYDDETKKYYDIIKEAIDYVEHISNVDIDWHEQDRIVNILRRIDNERI